MSFLKTIKNGIVDENPIFVQGLGLCPALVLTTSAMNGLGMGLVVTIILVISNSIISFFRKYIPDKIKLWVYLVIIAMFVTILSIWMAIYVPSLYDALGLFLPLVVVNGIILERAEVFANKNSLLLALGDGIGMGLGFTLVLTLLGSIREILGTGSIFGYILFKEYTPAVFILLPPGAFLTLGLLFAGFNKIRERRW